MYINRINHFFNVSRKIHRQWEIIFVSEINFIFMEHIKEMFSNSGDFDALVNFLQYNFTSVFLGNSKLWILTAIVLVTIVTVFITLHRMESMNVYLIDVPTGKMLAKIILFQSFLYPMITSKPSSTRCKMKPNF